MLLFQHPTHLPAWQHLSLRVELTHGVPGSDGSGSGTGAGAAGFGAQLLAQA